MLETCDLSDNWSEWSGDLTWPTKRQRYKAQEFWKISCTEISTWAETLPTCPILSRWSSAWIFLLLNEKFGVNIPCLLILFWARLPILLRLVHRPHKLPEQPGLAIWLSKLEFSFFDISVSEVSSRSNAGFVTCCRASHGQWPPQRRSPLCSPVKCKL